MGHGVIARSLTPVALRRWCALACVVGCGAFALSINRELGVACVTEYWACYSARVCNGEVWLRWDRGCPPAMQSPESGVTWIVNRSGECRFAWRPYHAQCTGCGQGDYESINIPLWPAAAGSLGAAAYAHGLV